MNRLGNQEQTEAHLDDMIKGLNKEDKELYDKLEEVSKEMSLAGVPFILIHNFTRAKKASPFIKFNFLSNISFIGQDASKNLEMAQHIWNHVCYFSHQLLKFVSDLWHVEINASSLIPETKGEIVFNSKES